MKLYALSLLLMVLASCSNNASDSATDPVAKRPETLDPAIEAQEDVDEAKYFIWNIDTEAKTKTLNPLLRQQYFSVDTLILGLNKRFPEVKLEKKGIGHDTLYTHISQAQHLTERMGSSGAEEYIALAVINLTSVTGVNFVRIDFTEGSHASPGVWSRESFSNYREANQDIEEDLPEGQ